MRAFFAERTAHTFKPWYPGREDDFVAQILRCAAVLFPRYHAAKWTPLVRDRHGHGARPDMVLVSRDYEEWWVVEVELAYHSVAGHIHGQLETLSHGIYDSQLVGGLKEVVPEAGEESLKRLVYVPPGLLCIVNEFVDGIARSCRSNCFEHAVLEPYHSDEGGWGVLVESMPSDILTPVAEGGYQLRLGKKMGDRIVVILPSHFPASFDRLEVVYGQGERRETLRLFSTGKVRMTLFPTEMVPPCKALRLELLDPDNRLARLVVQ